MTAEERMRERAAQVCDALAKRREETAFEHRLCAEKSASNSARNAALYLREAAVAIRALPLEGEQGEPIPPGIPLTAEEQAFSDELDALQEQGEPAPAREPWCTYCGTDTHEDAKCWSTRPRPWGPQNAGYKSRPQAGPAREPGAEESLAAQRDPRWLEGISRDFLGALVGAQRGELDRLRAEMAQELHIVFDGPPAHQSGRFVEVETADGKSVSVGRWEQRGDYWHLILGERK